MIGHAGAFVAIDTDQVLRRALTSRSRPTRGQYSPGDWVMLWKRRGEAEGHWEGPMQVIIEEANRWCLGHQGHQTISCGTRAHQTTLCSRGMAPWTARVH